MNPCQFIWRSKGYLSVSSVFLKEVSVMAAEKYGILDILDNDVSAIVSRIIFVQNHEEPLR